MKHLLDWFLKSSPEPEPSPTDYLDVESQLRDSTSGSLGNQLLVDMSHSICKTTSGRWSIIPLPASHGEWEQ